MLVVSVEIMIVKKMHSELNACVLYNLEQWKKNSNPSLKPNLLVPRDRTLY